MIYHPVRKWVLFGGIVAISVFSILILLSFAGIVPSAWALESAASIVAVMVAVFFIFLAHLAGHEIMTAIEEPRFSPIRLAIGIALAFALVSLFEIYM